MENAAVTAGLLALAMGLVEVVKGMVNKKNGNGKPCSPEHSEIVHKVELFAQRSEHWHQVHADILNKQTDILMKLQEEIHGKAA